MANRKVKLYFHQGTDENDMYPVTEMIILVNQYGILVHGQLQFARTVLKSIIDGGFKITSITCNRSSNSINKLIQELMKLCGKTIDGLHHRKRRCHNLRVV